MKKTVKEHMDQIASTMMVESMLWSLMFNNPLKEKVQKLFSFKAIDTIYRGVCKSEKEQCKEFLKEYPEKRLSWVLVLDCYENSNLMKVFDKMHKEGLEAKWRKKLGNDWLVDFEGYQINLFCSDAIVDKVEPLLGYKPGQLFERVRLEEGNSMYDYIPELDTWTEAEAYCKREKLKPEFTLSDELIARFEEEVKELVEEEKRALDKKFDLVSKQVRSFQKKSKKSDNTKVEVGDTCKVWGDRETTYKVLKVDGDFALLSGVWSWKSIKSLRDVVRGKRELKSKA